MLRNWGFLSLTAQKLVSVRARRPHLSGWRSLKNHQNSKFQVQENNLGHMFEDMTNAFCALKLLKGKQKHLVSVEAAPLGLT